MEVASKYDACLCLTNHTARYSTNSFQIILDAPLGSLRVIIIKKSSKLQKESMMNSTSFHQKIQIEFEFHHSNIFSQSNCNMNKENSSVGGIPTKQTNAFDCFYALQSKIEMRIYKELRLSML